MERPLDRADAPWGWVALVVAVAVAASVAGVGNEFVQDDLVIVVQNPRMQSLDNWRDLLTQPYWPPPWTEDHWRPMTSLALAVQFQLGGGEPLLFRIVSLLLYAVLSGAVLLLALRFLVPPAAVAAALLFAVHPLHVEAVALAVGQAELIVALLAVVMTAWYLRCRRTGQGWLRVRDWLLLVVLYLAAALTKEHGLVLPGLLVAAELTLVPGLVRARIRQSWPGFVVLAAVAVLAIQLRALVLGGDLVGSYPSEALDGVALGGRALTMLAVATHWFRLLAWPAHLRADYAPAELEASTGFGGPEALGLALLGLAVAVTWRCRRGAPVTTFGLLWVAIALFPVSNVLVPTSILIAERTLFLATVGAVIAVGGLMDLAWRLEGRRAAIARAGVLAAGVLGLALGLGRSVERWSVWRNETAYVARTAQDAPRSFRAQRAYGEVLFQDGKRDEGMAAYGRALQYAPPGEAWRVRNDLARRHFEEGASALAVQQLLASREQTPGEQETWNYLVLGLLNLGEYPAAKREAEAALARGFSVEVFEDLRSLADTAMKANVPAGAIRINVVRPESP